MSVPERRAPRWSAAADIDPDRGLILTILLVFLPNAVVDAAALCGIEQSAERFDQGLISFALFTGIFVIMKIVIERIGKVKLRHMLLDQLPTVWEIAKWTIAGILLGSLQFVTSLKYGYRFEEPGFIPFFIESILFMSTFPPLIEETIYRGICFVTLYNFSGKKRWPAYLGSTFLFLLSHAESYSDLFLHATTGLGDLDIILIVLFSLVTAYVYESTGKLLLCILVHSVANGIGNIGVLAGFLWGVSGPG